MKGAAALGAVAALGGTAGALEPKTAYAEDGGEVVVKHNWCQMCGPARTHCSTLCYLKDGRFVNVEGNPDAGNNFGRGSRTLCGKANAAMQVPYSSQRILYPMKRTGEKGEGKFERITWEQAIQEIADKLKEQKEQYGAESLGILSPQFYAVLGTLGRRFLNVHGSPNYMHSAICNSQRMFSRLVTLGGPNHVGATDTAPGQINKTNLLVSWGYNSENSAINQGNPNSRLNRMEEGMQVIDIRPMCDALANRATEWVPVRPGTDCALALAILNYIIENNLYDHDFVENWCEGFDELAEHVKQYTIDWASGITSVPADQIERVAHMMGTIKPMGINVGNGIGDQQNDGHATVAAVCLIEAITGNLGIAGGGGAKMIPPASLIPTKEIDVLTDRLPETEEDKKNGYMAGVSNLVAPETPRWFQTMKTQESGPTSAYYKAIMSVLTEDPYPLRCIIGQSSNPLSATRCPKKVEEALKKLDYYVVMDTCWNSSCNYADIVLPAATNYETSHQFGTKNSPAGTFIAINQGVLEPMGESHSDWQFYLDLAVAMGYGEDFWNGDMDACLREQLDGSGISLEDLRAADHGIFVERTDGAKPTEPVYQDYAKMFESLPNGKVQCYNSWIGGKPNSTETGELDPLPTYVGPVTSPDKTPELLEEYPLVITDVHAYRLCNHSYYVDVPYCRELQPYPWVKINPATAKKYGIEDGDWMKIESPYGSIHMTARYFEGIAPDVLMTRRGWWGKCDELGLPGYGFLDEGSEVNNLYPGEIEDFDPFHSAMSKQVLVKISKLEGGNE